MKSSPTIAVHDLDTTTAVPLVDTTSIPILVWSSDSDMTVIFDDNETINDIEMDLDIDTDDNALRRSIEA